MWQMEEALVLLIIKKNFLKISQLDSAIYFFHLSTV